MTESSEGGRRHVSRARDAVVRMAWDEAYREYSAAPAAQLDPADLESWATAGYLLGHVDSAIDALSRAHRMHEEAGDNARAVRTGFWVAFILMNRGEMAQAGGWLGRCQRLLAEVPEDAAEHGYLLVPKGFRQAAIEGDYVGAHATGQRIVAVGRGTGEPDLVAMGLNISGRALVRSGDVEEGMGHLDEAMVAVISGELSPPIAGTVYCSLIEACEEISEIRRAHEWTGALTRWCDSQQGMVTFTGQCLTHRSAILRHRGDWPGAEREALLACERFVGAADEQATGRARYQLGEVHRVRGEIAQAEDDYRRASEWGYEPQPGLALLRLAQGRTKAAMAALERLMAERTGIVERIPLLAAWVEVVLEAGSVGDAEKAVAELEEAADLFGTSALRAEAERARGRVLLASGHAHDGLGHLRAAYDGWRALDAPYEAARTRVLIGEACRSLGDVDTADMELEAARAVFTVLGAVADLARLPMAAAPAHGLTAREHEVLRLVATGQTNQQIADELYLAVKTVDRHVSNILTKLRVSSRTGATAYAYEHGLV